MTITGHETAQVFRRYAIVATKEQETAFEARAALLAAEAAQAELPGLRRLPQHVNDPRHP
jgi:hypothetical protein